MGRALPAQNNFSAGELDPLLQTRVDIEHYPRGAKDLTNVICLPQGGATRRGGTKYVATVAGPGDLADFRTFSFEFARGQTYLLMFRDQRIDVYKNDVFFLTITEDVDLNPLPWTEGELGDIRVTQSADTMLVFHGTHQTRKILRDTTNVIENFLVSLVTFNNPPQFDFKDADSPLPADVDEVQRIGFSVGDWNDNDVFRLKVEGAKTGRIHYVADRELLGARIEEELRDLPNLSATGIGSHNKNVDVDKTGVTVVVDPAAGSLFQYLVTFSGTAGGKDWPVIVPSYGDNVVGTVLVTDNIVTGGAAAENVWSDTRGWPQTGVFHQGRLWLGGSPSRPSTIWASRAGQFFDFDVGDGLDSDALDVTIDSDQINRILHLVSGRDLQIFTTSAEYVAKSEKLTPTEIAFEMQTRHGSTERVRPTVIDGATLFVDNVMRAVREFLFEFAEDAFRGDEISVLSQHLIRAPLDMAAQRTPDGDYVWLANAEGAPAVLNLNRAQGIKAWSHVETEGKIVSVVSVDQVIYFGVTRTQLGGLVQFIERLDNSFKVDCGIMLTETLPGNTVWLGADHLVGMTVDVFADGVYVGQQVVATGGQVTTERDDYTTLEVGLPFRAKVIPMPIEVAGATGSTLSQVKSIPRMCLYLRNSFGVYVNGYRIPERRFPASAMGRVPPLLDGAYDIATLGWERLPAPVIEQKEPGPFTVLGIGYELEV